MFFYFLLYVKPIWYLRLKPAFNNNFPDPAALSPADRSLISIDPVYGTEKAFLYDQVLQAWMKGIIPSVSSSSIVMDEVVRDVKDNYVFLRRFFHPIWSLYVLIIRVLTLHNPFRELVAFLKSRNVSRLNMFTLVKRHEEIEHYVGVSEKENCLVTVIIPTLNRYEYLRDTLEDLEKQTYKNFEVIVVDQSDDFNSSFYKAFKLNLRVIRQEQKELWKARNHAVRESKGEFVLLFDDDSRVEQDWIINHLRCIDFFNTDISSGVSLSKIGDKIPESYFFYKSSDQIDTGNVMIRRNVFNEVGLFDRQFERMRMGDGEFGLRCYLAGKKNISNPAASRVHLKVSEGGLREMGSWDAFRSKKLLGPRPIPSVLYLIRRYFGTCTACYYLAQMMPTLLVPYSAKGNRLAKLFSGIVAIVFFPLLVIPVIHSWRLSSGMIRKGPKIEFL